MWWMGTLAFGLTLPELLFLLLAWAVVVLLAVALMILAARMDRVAAQEGVEQDVEEDAPARGFAASEMAPAPARVPLMAAPPTSAPSSAALGPLPPVGVVNASGQLLPVSFLAVSSQGAMWGDLVPVGRIVPPTGGCLLN